jgi:PAS domain S-box-containing protein
MSPRKEPESPEDNAMRKIGAKNEREFKKLRTRAEEFLHRRSEDSRTSPVENVQKLMQELHVHQVELEMQNEELRNAQTELAESRDKYFDIYDLAPIGYFTLDEKGLILEVNLAGADLLGSDRAALIKKAFSRFVAPDSQDAYYSHRKQAIETGTKQVSEIELKRKNAQSFYVQIQSITVQENEGNAIRLRTVVVDITERKRAEMALLETHSHLEKKIKERTDDLLTINVRLLQEIEERKRMEQTLKGAELELHLLTSRLLTIQEDERKAIALDLHDTIAQNLVAIRMFVEMKLNAKQGGPQPGVSLERVYSMIGNCIAELRRIVDHLRPSILDDLGIIIAVNRLCEEFQEMNQELSVEHEVAVKEKEIPEGLKSVIYRILQEALNNVSKHSEASNLKISLRKIESRIELVIKDDGAGFDAEDKRTQGLGKGIGLTSMKERAYLSGGSISIQSLKGVGTAVMASWNY